MSALFRDPAFYLALRREVLPVLRTYPSINVWIPACASGEQAYAMAILLREEGLFERSRIWATEEDERLLEQARTGVYGGLEQQGMDYAGTGGVASLEEYYSLAEGRAVMRPLLRDQITFAQHSVGIDASFNEFQLILCRDALNWLDRVAAMRALTVLHDSLCRLGVLALGAGETLRLHPLRMFYAPLACYPGLFRRMDP
jgi:chemotaxis protein methyltransferase CheR